MNRCANRDRCRGLLLDGTVTGDFTKAQLCQLHNAAIVMNRWDCTADSVTTWHSCIMTAAFRTVTRSSAAQWRPQTELEEIQVKLRWSERIGQGRRNLIAHQRFLAASLRETNSSIWWAALNTWGQDKFIISWLNISGLDPNRSTSVGSQPHVPQSAAACRRETCVYTRTPSIRLVRTRALSFTFVKKQQVTGSHTSV